ERKRMLPVLAAGNFTQGLDMQRLSEPQLKGVVVKRLASIYAFLILLVATVCADEKKRDGGKLPFPAPALDGRSVQAFNEKREVLYTFVAGYHRRPAPDRVPLMLELLLKERILDHFLM